MLVRAAMPSDLPELTRLFDAYRVFYRQPSDRAAAERFLRERFARGDSQLFVAILEASSQAGLRPARSERSERRNEESGLRPVRSEAQPSEVTLSGFTQLYPSLSSVSLARIFVLNDLFVDPAARRAGVGRALLEAAHAFARDAGAVRVTLETAIDNAAAQALYESLGYGRDAAFHRYHLRFS